MVIVPSLDVRQGRPVGHPDLTPLDRARQLVDDGAPELHLVDMDGAETGTFANLSALAEVARAVGVRCRLAGGVSRLDDARRAIEEGFAGVLFSSAVFGDDDLLREIAALGDRAIVELEARRGFLEPRGGDRELVAIATGRGVLASARAAAIAGVSDLYLIDLAAEGSLGGPPLALVDAVAPIAGPRVRLHAGGGIRTLEDVRALASRGVVSAVIGRALAEHRFTIREAREAAA